MSHKLEQKIKAIAKEDGLILLYHYIDSDAPTGLTGTAHSITPAILRRHMGEVSRFFKFVSIQEFCKAPSKSGLAVVTFDDGYKNVVLNALPILNHLDIPCTLFLNPLTFSGGWNWRDKVRYLIHHQLENEFLQQNKLLSSKLLKTNERFYRSSKNPANNSATVDAALNLFLAGREPDIYAEYPYLKRADLVLDNDLVTYGNHTQNHYVLSSLTDRSQFDEIGVGEENLQNIASLPLSNCFSAPFGGDTDINAYTLSALTDFGYRAMLMSRQRRQPGKAAKNKELQILERFMPRSDDILAELVSL